MIKKFESFIAENNNEIYQNILNTIDLNKHKIKIDKKNVGFKIYDNPIDTAINNSYLLKFYLKIKRKYNKKVNNIPFPLDKYNTETKYQDSLLKLNNIAIFFNRKYENENDIKFKLIIAMCIHLMEIILDDLYFNIKPRMHDIYTEIEKIELPKDDTKEFVENFINKEGNLNHMIFFFDTNEIVRSIKNYY